MRRRRIKAFISWVFVAVLLLLVLFFRDSKVALCALVFWIFFPIVSTILNLFLKKKIHVHIELNESTGKGQEEEVRLTLTNQGWLSPLHIYVRVKVENTLTKECISKELVFPVVSKKSATESFFIRTDHCGYLKITVTDIILLDWIGFVAIRCHKNEIYAKGQTVVLPDTFVPQVILDPATCYDSEAQEWSPYRKGNDQTETHALRDYVPGDSLRQIHWKLSSKRGELIVRELSMPETKTLLVFWNRKCQGSAEEMDAMAESVASIMQALWENGEAYTLGWAQDEEVSFVPVGTEEELQQAIALMLKGEFIAEENVQNDYAKIIYFGMAEEELPEIVAMRKEAVITEVLCSHDKENVKISADGNNTIVYNAKTYREDLGRVEL